MNDYIKMLQQANIKIAELDKENASLNDQNKRVCTEIAELEKERDEHMAHAYYILETCMVFSPAHFEAHNLEQQAEGINELVAHLKVNTSYLMFTESTFREVESYYDFLLDQAKALKDKS
jgi:hypothetical protein